MKNTIATLLALLMLCTMGVTAFAEEPTQAPDTIITTLESNTSEKTVEGSLTKSGDTVAEVVYVEITWTAAASYDITAVGADFSWNPETCSYETTETPTASGTLTYTVSITNKSNRGVGYAITYEKNSDSPFESGFDEGVTYSADLASAATTAPSSINPFKTYETSELGGEAQSANVDVVVKVTGITDAAGVNTAANSSTQTLGTLTCTISNGGDCLAKGTKITMADGSLKNIEDITEGDRVLTYCHEAGRYEAQTVYLAWASEAPKRAFSLHFTNGIDVSVIGDHCFFEKESCSYVTILESNAESFVGNHFYNATAGRYEELLSVTYEATPVDYYEIYTEYNANCIADNMLNVAFDSREMLNIYRFNEDLSVDREQLEKDIAEFGLYEYPADANYPKEMYDALGWKFVYLMIGKGFGTMEEFVARRDAFFEMIAE